MHDIFLFEDYRLDRRNGLSRRGERGAFVPVAIGSRALDILGALIMRPGDLVTRDELIAAVWPTTVVEDSNLNMQIAALRRIRSGSYRLACRQTQTRQEKLAVLRISVRNDFRDDDRGDGTQPCDDVSRFAEPPHVCIARRKKAVSHGPGR